MQGEYPNWGGSGRVRSGAGGQKGTRPAGDISQPLALLHQPKHATVLQCCPALPHQYAHAAVTFSFPPAAMRAPTW